MVTDKYQAFSTNILANSPHYGRILQTYNEWFAANNGKVNALKFWREVIVPLIPNYSKNSWYQFLRRFKDAAGIRAASIISTKVMLPRVNPGEAADVLEKNLLNNSIATQEGINLALNIGNEKLKELAKNPQLMTFEKAMELFFKAMKAQDSRIAAVGKIKEDSREQAKFERAFGDSSYVGDDPANIVTPEEKINTPPPNVPSN